MYSLQQITAAALLTVISGALGRVGSNQMHLNAFYVT
jgi:hypothetical protein